jgi:hypothetical protein
VGLEYGGNVAVLEGLKTGGLDEIVMVMEGKTMTQQTVKVTDYYEIDRQVIDGRELILMEHSIDGDEVPAIIVDTITQQVVMDEVWNGFDDYREDEARTRQTGRR